MVYLNTLALMATGLLADTVSATLSQTQTWSNVRIGGGGGFIPGIVFNTGVKGLAYARADIGGLYRLNYADDTWTPLLDWVNSTNWHDWGIDAVATDPIDTNRVYVAAGMYTNSWDPNMGSIMRSTDQGATWAQTTLPFKVGGNMPGRGLGERLVIDPNKNNILYFGARSGHGLYKSTDYGVTWASVPTFTWPGTYFLNASNEYSSDIDGIAWITFDSTTATKGTATPRIFVGVADVGQSVFKSEDAGATWAWVSGEPSYGFLPHKGVLSPSEHVLYISYANGAGPYDGTNGTVHKYNITSGVWTDISPTSLSSTYYGYGGLSVDLQVPGTLMVAALNCWWPDELIFRSVDSGATWTPIWEWNGYPSMTLHYTYDVTNAPWLVDSTSTAQFTSKVGWMVESLAIDPFDSNHWLYGTGATIYGGHDLQLWDTTHLVTLKSLATGIEETAVLNMACPPGGPPLLSAVGDIGGFYHSSLTTAPTQAFHSPTYGTTSGLDYAGNKPANVVRSGESSTAIGVSTSTDFGASWNIYYGATLAMGTGKVAYSADADTILMMSSTGPLVSRYVATFSAVTGLPSGSVIASDKRTNAYFYGGSAGSIYVSTDIGVTFTKTAALGASTSINTIRAHPTIAGDVWVTTDIGLFHSTDFASTFTQVSTGTVLVGYSFDLGAASTTTGYAVIYGFFNVTNVVALYKTEDKGTNWYLISDASHGFGASSANVVAADISNYGRVYVGTNGRGIFAGVPSGTLPSGTATATSTTATSTSSKATTSSTTLSTVTTSKATTTSTTSVVTTSTSKATTTSTTAVTSSTTKVTTTTTSSSATSTVTGVASAYGQCGGSGWTGPVLCPTGFVCTYSNAWYSQCVVG